MYRLIAGQRKSILTSFLRSRRKGMILLMLHGKHNTVVGKWAYLDLRKLK